MKPCQWKQCGGWMREIGYAYQGQFFIEEICGKCGRSCDMEHEKEVYKEQRKNHRNIHFYQKSGMHLTTRQNHGTEGM